MMNSSNTGEAEPKSPLVNTATAPTTAFFSPVAREPAAAPAPAVKFNTLQVYTTQFGQRRLLTQAERQQCVVDDKDGLKKNASKKTLPPVRMTRAALLSKSAAAAPAPKVWGK